MASYSGLRYINLNFECSQKVDLQQYTCLFIHPPPPRNEVRGYIGFTLSACLSVRPSVRLSVRLSVSCPPCSIYSSRLAAITVGTLGTVTYVTVHTTWRTPNRVRNNNSHWGIMLHVRGYFHIGINSLDCCEYSWVAIFTHEAWLEMRV